MKWMILFRIQYLEEIMVDLCFEKNWINVVELVVIVVKRREGWKYEIIWDEEELMEVVMRLGEEGNGCVEGDRRRRRRRRRRGKVLKGRYWIYLYMRIYYYESVQLLIWDTRCLLICSLLSTSFTLHTKSLHSLFRLSSHSLHILFPFSSVSLQSLFIHPLPIL